MKETSKKTLYKILIAVLTRAMGCLLFCIGAGFSFTINRILALSIGIAAIIVGIIYLIRKHFAPGRIGLFLGVRITAFAFTDYWVSLLCIGFLFFVTAVTWIARKRVTPGILFLITAIFMVLFAVGTKLSWQHLNIVCYLDGLLLVIDGLIFRLRK